MESMMSSRRYCVSFASLRQQVLVSGTPLVSRNNQSYAQEINTFIQRLDVCEILILGVLLKKSYKNSARCR